MLALFIGLLLCGCLLFLGNQISRNTAQKEYVGMSKEKLWTLLCSKSGQEGTPITAFDFAPEAGGTRHAMLTADDAGSMPEIFRTASKWRWDSPKRQFHEFFFNAQGEVDKVRVDTSSRL